MNDQLDNVLNAVLELLAEAEIDEVNAIIPVDMYHSLSEHITDYVRASGHKHPFLAD